MRTFVIIMCLLIACSAEATIKRSEKAKRDFQKISPCPATGKKTGACPGYVIDHINPLACGGADAPFNMQWQSYSSAKKKDRWERKGCK